MNEERISKIAGRVVAIGIRSPDGPKPKFDHGDKVITYNPNMTEVWEVGDWDDHLNDRRYLVMNPQTRQKIWMNEKSMKKAADATEGFENKVEDASRIPKRFGREAMIAEKVAEKVISSKS